MANIWDEYERDLFSEKKKRDEKPASSNIWDDLEQEHFNPKPQAGLTSSQISSSVDRYQAGLYGVGEAIAEGVGAKDSAEWLKAQREENEFLADKASKRARDLGAVDRWEDVHGVGDFGSYAKGLAIQSLPYAAEALAGGVLARGAMSGTRAALTAATAAKDVEGVAAATKALNAGSQAGAVAASYPSAVGDVLGNQREQSNGETRGGVAAALAVPYAALNAFGVEGALARGTAFKNTVNILDRGTGLTGGAARMAATGAGVALKEGASETGQEMLNQVGRMSVDANEDFLSAAAQERFKESFIGGATLGGLAGGLGGGWRRSEGGNELSQAMGNKAVNQPDITTTQFVPPAAPPVAPAEITPTTTDTVASEQQVPPTAPAVSGGTTDIAAAQQQAQADQQAQQVADQQAQQAQALQERRDTVAAYFGAEPTLDNGQHVGGMIMGKAFTDPAKYNAELDKLAANEDQKSELRRKVEAAYMQTLPAEKRKLAAIQGGALKFWTNKPDLAAVAEGINTAMTELVAAGKGTNDAKLTQMAQMYEALTGQEAPAYAAAQQVQPKGAKNDKLQLQTTTGLGTVPVEGGTTEAVSGAAGDVRPAQVQPVGATSVGAGPSDVQAGQPSTGGVRPSAGDVSSVVGGEATPQVSEATDGQTQTTTGLGDGGQVSGQTGQVADVSVPPTTGGTTEAVPAASAEKIEHDGDILSNLYRQVLTPTQEKRGGATLEQRIEMVRLALIEQASEAEIAELTGLSLTTVDAQLRRLGVVMRPQYSQANLDTRAAIAERLGISAEVLAGVEDVTVEGVARPSKEQKQAAQAKYLSDSITADVAPEDRARSVSRLMATYAATGEQYECVTPKAELQRGKLKQFERLDVLFQRAADAYTSPEFPQGIPRRDLLELVTPRRVITLKDSISDQQRAEFEGESQDFDNTKYLSEELYGGEEQEGKSMGTVASAGGSQGSVETQRKADLGKIEKLQTQMGKLAADDVEGRAAIQKQLNIEYAKYHVRTLEAALANLPKPSEMTDEDAALKIKLFTQLDAARAEFAAASAGESTTTAAAPKNEVSDEVKAVKAKFKETKGDLTKFDMGELQLLLDEANKFKNMALAKKLDAEMAGRTTTTEPVNAVQEPSPAQVPVQERAGSSETVGQGDTEGGQAAAEGEVKAEQEEVIKTPAEQWADLAAQFPAMPSYESLSKDAKIRWDDVATRGVANLAAADKILNTAVKEQPVEAPSTVGTTEAVTESNVGMATELTPEQAALVEGPVSELTEGQTIRLEKHYDAKRGTSEFLTKLHGDIALYAAKGAAAVHAAIRDIVKALYTAVLAVAVVFNPTYMNKVEAFTVSPAQEYSVTQEVKAEAPAEAAAKMSTAAKQAYATLMPALKADLTAKNKLLVMADKPSGRIFVFTPDGKLVLEKKSLFGLAKGDFYKGNNDLPANRITPAGLHNLVMVDAAKGGAAAKTAGEYDFGKVFGIVDENPGVLTIMHSVWLHENDAAKRTAALKNDNAADSRYSFGCINVDKATYKNLIDNYGQQMDGAKLFVVPDNQERVMDFVTGAVAQNKTGEDKLVRQSVQPVTTTTTGNRQGVTQASTERNIVGKEEKTLFGIDTRAKNPYTSAELTKEIEDFIRTPIPARKLVVVESIEALVRSSDPTVQKLGAVMAIEGAYGVASNGRAYLVANRIEKGQGRAKFMHEVGAHVGLENLLPKAMYDKLTQQIVNWAKQGEDSIESVLAVRAAERVMNAGTVQEDRRSEMLAYFIEEAVQMGIDPTAAPKTLGPLHLWFRTLWAAFKAAVRKLGFNPEAMTARDVVDMAFGAARLEMAGTYHGTAAAFRKFSHKFMSTGEGRQAFGWGSYLAQAAGVAKGYWADDVDRKTKANALRTDAETLAKANAWAKEKLGTDEPLSMAEIDRQARILQIGRPYWFYETARPEGSLMRVDVGVEDQDILDWNTLLTKQPAVLRRLTDNMSEAIRTELEDELNASLDELTGEELYRALGVLEKRSGLISEQFEVEDYNSRLRGAGTKQIVSTYLDEKIGIPALKFLDQNSRGDVTFAEVNLKNKQELLKEKERTLAQDTEYADKWEKKSATAPAQYKDEANKTWLAAVSRRTSSEFEVEMLRQEIEQDKKRILKLSNPTRNLVVFNDKNIFRVGGQVAADKDRMRFGKSMSARLNEGLENTLPASVAKPAKSVVTNLATAAKNGLLAAGITEDIVNMAGKYMRSAQDYLTAQYARQKTRLDFEQRIEHILDAFDKLPKALQGEGAGSVNRFILDSTMAKKWGFYPGEHRIGTTLFEVDPDLAKRFVAIEQESPAAAQVIRDVFEHGYQALKAKKEAIDAAVEREFAERAKAADGDADLMAEVAQAKKLMRTQLSKIQNVDFTTPYAYLGRYGDYVVAAKSAEFKYWEGVAAEKGENKERAAAWLADNVSNPDHYVVQFAETQGEADQIAADLMATGKFDMDGSEAGPKEDIGSFIGSDVHLAVARLRNLISRQEGESGEGNAELDRMVSDLYLMTAAENSARKSEIMRKYVSGANANMMRNLATSGRADAHFLSTMKHNDEVVDSLERMRTEAKRNVREAMPLYNELYKRQTASLEYKTPSTLSQALTQATTLWFLSTSPAFYLQQLLQTTVLSLPYMSGRLGYFRSVRAIKGAYSDVATMVKGLGTNAHIDFSKAPEDVRAMLQTLVGMGKIDIGIDADAKARAGEHNVLNTVMRKLQGVNNRIEAINRSTAAIAAYRGYIQRYGAGDTAAATKFAADVVSNTHGSYDGFNTPRILNSDTGRLVGQFKRFQIIQLSMLGKLIHGAFKGASSEERLVARRALAFITGHMAVVGGALGVPFVQQVASLLLTAFGDDDEPKDLEYKLRQAIGDDTTANLLLNGVPSALGVNLGGKLGMGNVASLLPFTDVDLSTRSGYEKVVVGLMGPFFGGLAPKFADGAGMIAKGEYYKGLELLMPNGIGNAMKGARFASEGVTMRNGDVVLKPEEISLVDAAFQAVGLPTNTITHRQYTQKVAIEFDKFYTERAASIKGAYVNANRDGDTEGMAEARKDWEELQASRKRNGYTIQPMSELFKATVAARKREASTVGGVETTKANKQFVKNII